MSKIDLEIEIEIGKPISIYYNSVYVGDFIADIIISIKSSKNLEYLDEQLLYNRVRNSGLQIGLLFNFGIKPEFCRKSSTNNKDKMISELDNLPFDE